MPSFLEQISPNGNPLVDWGIWIACVNLLLFCCFAYGEVLIVVGIFQIAVAFGALAAGWGLHYALRFYSASLLWLFIGSAKIFIRNKRHTQYSEASIEHETEEEDGEPEAILKAKAILALQAHLEKTSKLGYEFELVDNDTSENSESEEGSEEDGLNGAVNLRNNTSEASKSKEMREAKDPIHTNDFEATTCDNERSSTEGKQGELELV